MQSGFQIEYDIRTSSLGEEVGQGIFTKQFIPRGTLIWKYCPGINVKSYHSKDEVKAKLEELDVVAREFFVSHVYLYDGKVNEILDDAKFWNHSETPNTGYGSGHNVDWESSYSIRDIEAGEELLDDYGVYEYPDWFVELARQYGTPQDFIVVKESVKPGFHIEYEVRQSSLGGLGLFAKQQIPQHALIWKYVLNQNIREFHSEADVRAHLSSLPSKAAQCDWLSHVYAYAGTLNEILDDGRLWNHSEDPNTCSGVGGDWDSTFAKRDIAIGEELVDDYGVYEYPDWLLALYAEYGIPIDFVVIKKDT